jgi:EAL domain-containing protein (putative c-di-GMP-specific phosphodiesterase class I)
MPRTLHDEFARDYRASTLRHIAVLQKNLKARQNITSDLQEVIMALSITYEQIEAEILERGETKGSEKTAQAIALTLLQEGMSPPNVARITGLTLEQLPKP